MFMKLSKPNRTKDNDKISVTKTNQCKYQDVIKVTFYVFI